MFIFAYATLRIPLTVFVEFWKSLSILDKMYGLPSDHNALPFMKIEG